MINLALSSQSLYKINKFGNNRTRFRDKTTCTCQNQSVNLKSDVNRRQLVSGIGVISTFPCFEATTKPALGTAKPALGDWSSPGLASTQEDTQPRFFKTDSGVKIQEILQGRGKKAEIGNKVLIDYVLRRANGYFIYGTIEGVSFQPKDVPVGPIAVSLNESSSVIQGLKEALLCMQEGGKIRALIPPNLGYVSEELEPKMPTFAANRQIKNHKEEPLLFEIQMLRVLQ
eukprot:TRINITY_DN34375_c0_g1_i1.p1 TRINITY_DN34375_c0_g1~~TRINITY_DN34375_c0_g1_i1.p1  ORF type:complete len:229 (-),score=29.02 TRINITY_DN34375_c0_g1_i1:127-813(-)